MKVAVLGAGKVGYAIAVDLARKFKVFSYDMNLHHLDRVTRENSAVTTNTLDFTDQGLLRKAVQGVDLVVNAVPGFLGYSALQTCIESRKDVVDISFMPESYYELDEKAKSYGVRVIPDAGVAPGLCHLISGHFHETYKLRTLRILVGGLPKKRDWPFNYKATFSAVDVLEEYTRPAMIKSKGEIRTVAPTSGLELIETPIGTLEAFYTDGLRSILKTCPDIESMEEKTLRYPGHIEYINVLRSAGFFDKTMLNVKGLDVAPLEFSAKILEKAFLMGENEHDLLYMEVRGSNGSNECVAKVYDEYCTKTEKSAMARTTGYTATGCVNLLAENLVKEPGVYPLEILGKQTHLFEFLVKYYAERGINIEINE